MWRNAHDTYLEQRILSADALELVHLLYQACASKVADARRHLAEGEIRERARSISKAGEILAELNNSLDHSRGGEISTNLSRLYDYMHHRLVEANCLQSDAILTEVGDLLATLTEGWDGVRQDAARVSQTKNHWMPAMSSDPEPAHASSGWSF